jgi:hypothetical protein
MVFTRSVTRKAGKGSTQHEFDVQVSGIKIVSRQIRIRKPSFLEDRCSLLMSNVIKNFISHEGTENKVSQWEGI